HLLDSFNPFLKKKSPSLSFEQPPHTFDPSASPFSFQAPTKYPRTWAAAAALAADSGVLASGNPERWQAIMNLGPTFDLPPPTPSPAEGFHRGPNAEFFQRWFTSDSLLHCGVDVPGARVNIQRKPLDFTPYGQREGSALAVKR
ncbi:hypothetical protein KUCAC02_017130, partial [Chaenocephalus aceratus]